MPLPRNSMTVASGSAQAGVIVTGKSCAHLSHTGKEIVARSFHSQYLCHEEFCALLLLTSIRGLEGKLGELLLSLSRDANLVILFCADGLLRKSDTDGVTGEIVNSLAPEV